MCKQLRNVFCDMKEINEHLKYCRNYRRIVYDKYVLNTPLGINAYIEDRETWFTLTYKKGDIAATYHFRKDGAEKSQFINGAEAFRILSEYYKVPKFDYDVGSAKPILWKNDKYECKRVNAISYDINSAYSYAMLKPMPDTSVEPRCGKVKPGEIGFVDDDGLKAVFSGFCLWVFPLMESPFKRFIEHWYEEKKNGNPKAKGVLNYSVGYLQKVNPFLRATILTYCNNLIQSLIDTYDDIIYCNTDSIVSLTPKDLPIGKEIGEWKVEHEGLFAFNGFNYQWDFEPPHYRGKSRKWFKKGWDILKDDLPISGNVYKYDKGKIKIIVV